MTKTQHSDQVSSPIATGTGLLTLDVVFSDKATDPLGLWAGGTFGNVMVALSYLGWESYPIARLHDDQIAKFILDDLSNLDVNTDYIVRESSGTSPVIIEYIRHSPDGKAKHSFSFRCPLCGQRLPSYRPITSTLASSLSENLPSPQVFFFDRVSRAALNLAKHYSESGAVVVFEPTSIGNPNHFQEALEISHIVKYSRDRLSENEVLPGAHKVRLVIETMGNLGLRYLNQFGEAEDQQWISLTPFRVREVRDAAGSGDWCTAGMIHMLASQGLSGLERLTPDTLAHAMRFAQALGAWNCMYEGARGGMYRINSNGLFKMIDDIIHGLDADDIALSNVVIETNNLESDKEFCFECRSKTPCVV